MATHERPWKRPLTSFMRIHQLGRSARQRLSLLRVKFCLYFHGEAFRCFALITFHQCGTCVSIILDLLIHCSICAVYQ